MLVLPASEPVSAAAARRALVALHTADLEGFQRLFLLEQEAELAPAISLPLEGASLVQACGPLWRGLVRIWPFEDRYYVSDSFTSDAEDRVYPVYLDQAAFFAQRLRAEPADLVLDVGTGSGILAVESARTAARAVGIDLNARATEFARFNAMLNGVSNTTFMTTSVEEFEPDEPFDLVLCNPPFTAVPEPKAWYLHGSAGFDGLRVFRRVLERVPNLVKPAGRIQFLLNSLGSAERPLALDLIKRAFPNAGIEIHHLYSPKCIPIEQYAVRFETSPAYGAWRSWLRDNGCSHVYRMLITVDLAASEDHTEHDSPGHRFAVIESFGTSPTLRNDPPATGGWEEMLLRYGSRTGSHE